MYVNQGPDPRAGGRIGTLFAAVQRKLSFKSPHEPSSVVIGKGRWQLMLARSVPKSRPYISIALPRPSSDRIMTFRAGWRYDKYWGDKVTCLDRGDAVVCPPCDQRRPWECEWPQAQTDRSKVGGYIADVIVKLRQTQVVHYVLLLALVLPLAACGKKKPQVDPTVVRIIEPVEVKVPIAVKAVPPAELLAAVRPPLPTFVAPQDPAASSALTLEGERLLRAVIQELLTRITAWEAWAQAAPE